MPEVSTAELDTYRYYGAGIELAQAHLRSWRLVRRATDSHA